jgi:GntR family transcriptional regulator
VEVTNEAGQRKYVGGAETANEVGQRKYEAVREWLASLVQQMTPGDRLPTERALASDFGVSRMTVRQAINGLERAGNVHRIQGSGTYVSDPRISKTMELTGFSEDMRSRGMEPTSVVVAVTHEFAGAPLGQALFLSPGDDVVRVERVRLADNVPMCLETVHLRGDIFDALGQDSLTGSLYDSLIEKAGIKIVEAAQTITATVLDKRQATLLRVPVLSPAIVITRVSYDAHHSPIEHAVSLYRADRYDIQMTIKRSIS